jgi:hypothetical protein
METALQGFHALKERTEQMRRLISREEVAALHKARASVTQISIELGCSKGAVSKILKSMKGPTSNPAPAAITGTRLLHLLQCLYEYLWQLKKGGFVGAPKKLLLHRLGVLRDVIRAD